MAEAERRGSPADAGTVAQIVERLRTLALNLPQHGWICRQAADLLASPREDHPLSVEAREQAIGLIHHANLETTPAGYRKYMAQARALLNLPPTTGGGSTP